ncbi:MAG: DNA translocase FtsK [Ruminococcaceae bacterium]|nr:DNA translocase FtsK [Oscillospiraceae bacterium]
MDKLATLIVLAVITIVLTNVLFSFSVVNFVKRCAALTGKCKDKISGAVSRVKAEKQTEKQKREDVEEFDDDVDDEDDEDDEDSFDGPMEYQPLPYGDPDDVDLSFEYKRKKREKITEDGEIIEVSEGEVPPPSDEDAPPEKVDSFDDEDNLKNDARVSDDGEKPQIHIPGTVADKSLDGLVFSKPSQTPYRFPTTDLLDIGKSRRNPIQEKNQAEATARKLEAVLKSFGIEARVSHYSIGPSVTRYELIPNVGVRVNRIKNLTDDIALNLAASSIRIEAPIPGKSAIGIEVPNKEVRTVYFREIIESDAFRYNRSKLAACLGSGISGEPVVVDLAKMPHLMIAGTTGSGKSVCTNGIIMSMLFNASPDEVKMILIDPKMVEFSKYNGIPHLLLPVVTEPKKAAAALSWAVDQMEKRYKLLAMYGVRDLKSYNQYAEKNGLNKMPAIVIIIDELADLMMVARDSVEQAINRIAQKARAAGMHLVVATQRPSVDIITGLIKSNIPVRIALKVSSQVDSRTIIDVAGAEKLLGRGDMLYAAPELSKSMRIQGSYVSDGEIEGVVEIIKKTSTAQYAEDVMQKVDEGIPTPTQNSGGAEGDGNLSEDELLFRKSVKLALEIKKISASMIQRKFSIGFNRAARIIDMMEERGVISSADGSKPRQIIVDSYDFGDDADFD